MRPLGEAAIDLPWLSPSVGSLLALARSPLETAWPTVRTDPGFVLLLARVLGHTASPLDAPDSELLDRALHHLQPAGVGFVDWNQPGPDAVYQASVLQAMLAERLAEKAGVDPRQAWIAGLLAPLGWLAICTVDPAQVDQALRDDPARRRDAWGLDHTAIARRLARLWRLPPWLTAVLGHLGLHVNIAQRLGADPRLFQVVQLAVRLHQQRDPALGLPVGAEAADLIAGLQLPQEEVEAVAADVLASEIPVQTWDSPAKHPLLADLLRLALESRRQTDRAWVRGLHDDLDRLQEALERQVAEEADRLHVQKLDALAELAAGAGHEINNPLAVISGQAQYILKQFDLFDGPADEIEDVGEYLAALKGQVLPSLNKIIGQARRINTILTDLMQFARPAAPRLQPVCVDTLVRDAFEAVTDLARERQVRLQRPEGRVAITLSGDPAHLRQVLTGLLRNAIEAAPADGWAGLRVERPDLERIALIVEDTGPGPTPAACEHLFDPFFSGRSAGRGRGLGLSTAWRLARQHGGDVHFAGRADGRTRFVLSLPLPPAVHGHCKVA